MIGIRTLTIGYTKDIELAEKIARVTGAKFLSIETRPEGDTLLLDSKEQAKWRSRGWRLEGRTAKKTLVANIVDDHEGIGTHEERKGEVQSGRMGEGYSKGGRLKASMLVESANKGSSEVEDDSSLGQDDDAVDDEMDEQSE